MMRTITKLLHPLPPPLLAVKTPLLSSTAPEPQLLAAAGNDDVSPLQWLLHSREVFRNDLYEYEILDEYYEGDVGPHRIKFAVQWPLSVKGAKVDLLEKIMYIHGIWPFAKVLTPAQMLRIHHTCTSLPQDIHQVLLEYKQNVLKYWPNMMHDPKNLGSARWILKQWKRHGLLAGMSARMYLFYALAFRSAFPDNFGITVDEPMKLKEASQQVNEVMKNLELFGEHVGRDVYAEIKAIIDPNDIHGPRIIREIRPHFIRVLKQGKAKWRPDNVDIKVRYSGHANDGDNIVILPSCRKF